MDQQNSDEGQGLPVEIGEVLRIDQNTGSAGLQIPLPLPESRSGFTPQLQLQFGSRRNGSFGVGWDIPVGSVTRGSRDHHPTYRDHVHGDSFFVAGAGEVLPETEVDENGREYKLVTRHNGYAICRFHARKESGFTRVEQWTDVHTSDVHWRTVSSEGVTSIYGLSKETRLADPEDTTRVYRWLLERRFDDQGNGQLYEYKEEDQVGVDDNLASEYERLRAGSVTNRYLKRVLYGNSKPSDRQNGDVPEDNRWYFSVVLDYGEHDTEEPTDREVNPWPVRPDPFSRYGSGFEIRYYRLCHRILVFHHIDELGPEPEITDSLNLEYDSGHSGSADNICLSRIFRRGYRRRQDGELDYKDIPPVELTYTKPEIDHEVREFESPHDISERPADLYGEGVNGLLKKVGNDWYYKTNLGRGKFSQGKPVDQKPVDASAFRFMDIEGDGRPDLVRHSGADSGYHELNEEQDGWNRFISFTENARPGYVNANLEWMDVTGSGQADLAVREQGSLTYYESEGKDGFAHARRITLPETSDVGPPTAGNDLETGYFVANLSGSGQDIVVVRNGHISYWPSLGYGRYGHRVTMDHVPRFDYHESWDPGRIRFVDMNGTGRADLLYLGSDGIRYWLNESGNSLAETRTLDVCPPVHDHLRVDVMDLLGEGTPCLVWMSALPGGGQTVRKYIRLTGKTPPYLLSGIENNMGKETRLEYESSAAFYLSDRAEGAPWKSRLSSHVPVVKRVEQIDHVTGSRHHRSYRYRDAYFDEEERRIGGFALVDQYDTEQFQEYPDLASEDYAAPLCQRTWFHDGSPDPHRLQIRDKYRGDSQAPPSLESAIEDESGLDARTIEEAYRMLAGRMIRQEVYAADGTQAAPDPYTVQEMAWKIRCIQPASEYQYGRFLAFKSETRSWEYDENPADPRVTQQVVLKVDAFGYPVRSCDIFYPRREGLEVVPEQGKLYATVEDREYIHMTDRFYRLGLTSRKTSFELFGLNRDGSEVISWRELKKQVDQALDEPLEYGHRFESEPDSPSGRRISMSETYYLGVDGEPTRRNEEIDDPVREHHKEEAVFDEGYTEQVYGDRVDQNILEELGYRLRDHYWWQPSEEYSYLSADRFYLLREKTDPFGGSESVTYDPYYLTIAEKEDALGNRTVIETDYVSLKPTRIKNPNHTITERCYDSLNQLVATTMYGESIDANSEVKVEGDLPMEEYERIPDRANDASRPLVEAVVTNPEEYLQGMSEFYWYDLFAWKRSRDSGLVAEEAQPVSKGFLVREKQNRSLYSDQQNRVIKMIQYHDGFGRSIQTKQAADPGEAYVRADDGQISKQVIEHRWRVSGGMLYNNKGDLIKEYDPLFTGSFAFEPGDTFMKHGASPVYYYDPLGRHIKTDTPKGFYRKVSIAPWEMRFHDENDTVGTSFYYETRIAPGLANEAEMDAIDKAKEHEETPESVIIDPMGREVIQRKYLDFETSLDTFYRFDIAGNRTTVVDPRQHALNQQRSEVDRVATERTRFDMLGRALYKASIDSGESWSLQDVMHRSARNWTARGDHMVTRYDPLSRPVSVELQDPDTSDGFRLVESMKYGEDLPAGEARRRNALGMLVEHRDQAGLLEYRRYDIQSRFLEQIRTLRAGYKDEADWSQSLAMEAEAYKTTYDFDSFGRVTRKQLADGTVQRLEYLLHGPLSRVHVSSDDGDLDEYVIAGSEYNALEQKTKVEYGNGVQSSYRYEETTHRLKSLRSRRREESENGTDSWHQLQEVDYTYDPVGNITRKDDRTREHLLAHLPAAHDESSRFSDYSYDACYRLVRASGWTHEALRQQDYASNGVPPDAFKGTRHLTLNNGDALVPYTRSYSYDPAGNMEQVKQTGAISWTRKMWISETSNRSLPESGWNGSVRSDQESLFDEAGNLTKLDHLEGNLRWNYRNELVQATVILRSDKPDDADFYVYGSDGGRIRKVEERIQNGSVTRREKIYLDGCEIKREFRGDEVVLERSTVSIQEGDRKVALIHHWTTDVHERETEIPGSRAIHYQLDDGFGSTAVEVNGEGKVISYEEYFPYAESAFIAGNNVREVARKEYRYSGKERDDATGLYYYGFRYYAPWMSRWLKPDPAGPVDGWNLYAFLRGNPVGRSDAAGLSTDEEEERRAEARQKIHNESIGIEDLDGIIEDPELREEITESWRASSVEGRDYHLYYPKEEVQPSSSLQGSPEKIAEHIEEEEAIAIRTDPNLREESEEPDEEEVDEHSEKLSELQETFDEIQQSSEGSGGFSDSEWEEYMSEVNPEDMTSSRREIGEIELRGIDRPGDNESEQNEPEQEESNGQDSGVDSTDEEETDKEEPDEQPTDRNERGDGQGRGEDRGRASGSSVRREEEAQGGTAVDPERIGSGSGDGEERDGTGDSDSGGVGLADVIGTELSAEQTATKINLESRLDDARFNAREARILSDFADEDLDVMRRHRNGWLRAFWEHGSWGELDGTERGQLSQINDEIRQLEREANARERAAGDAEGKSRNAGRAAAASKWLRRAGHVGTAVSIASILKKSWDAYKEEGLKAGLATLAKEGALELIGIAGGMLFAAGAAAMLASAPLWVAVAGGAIASAIGYWVFKTVAEKVMEGSGQESERRLTPPPQVFEHPLLLSY